jgi:hypothetical protein
MMAKSHDYFSGNVRPRSARTHKFRAMLFLSAILCVLAPANPAAAETNVSDRVSVTHTGFGRNRATGVWSTVMTVKNTSGSAIDGPVQVVFTNLSANATMVNNTGMRDGSPSMAVSAGTLAAGASVKVSIQFNNQAKDFITFTPVTYSGGSQP